MLSDRHLLHMMLFMDAGSVHCEPGRAGTTVVRTTVLQNSSSTASSSSSSRCGSTASCSSHYCDSINMGKGTTMRVSQGCCQAAATLCCRIRSTVVRLWLGSGKVSPEELDHNRKVHDDASRPAARGVLQGFYYWDRRWKCAV